MLIERLHPHLYRVIVDLVRASKNGFVAGIDRAKPLPTAEEAVRGEGPTEAPEDGDALPDILAKSLAFYEWTQLEPKLASVDLRAYLFVSRERTPGFIGAAELLDLPAELVRKLLNGTELEQAGLRAELRSLTSDKVEALLDQGLTELRALSGLKDRVPVVNGLALLVQVHPALQKRLLDAISEFPSGNLGKWVPFYMRSTFTDSSVAASLKAFQARLESEGDDAMREALAVAAQSGKK